MRDIMPKKSNLKRTISAFFSRKRVPVQSDNDEEQKKANVGSAPHRSSFEYRPCCLPSFQHTFRLKTPALTLESSQVASASAFSDMNSLFESSGKKEKPNSSNDSSSVRNLRKPSFMVTPIINREEPDSDDIDANFQGKMIEAWQCTLHGSVQQQGTLCLMSKALIFRGTLLSCKPKVIILLKDIVEVLKKNILSPGIEIITKQRRKYIFLCFERRTRAFNTIKRQVQLEKIKNEDEQESSIESSSTERGNDDSNNAKYFFKKEECATIIHERETCMSETIRSSFPNHTPVQLFQMFFSDDSEGFSRRLHDSAEDQNLVTTKWKEDRNYGMVRNVSFVAKISGVPMGPPATRVEERQWYTLDEQQLVFDTVQVSLDIPFADSFEVESHWVASFDESSKTTELVVKSGVHWKKKIFLRKQVESITNQKTQRAHRHWLSIVNSMMPSSPVQPQPIMSDDQRVMNNDIVRDNNCSQQQRQEQLVPSTRSSCWSLNNVYLLLITLGLLTIIIQNIVINTRCTLNYL